MKHRAWRMRLAGLLLLACAAGLLAGCQGVAGAPAELATALEAVESAPGGWKSDGAARLYEAETLRDLPGEQPEALLAYGFEQAAAQRFINGSGAALETRVYRLDTPESAYGLFSARRGSQSIKAGNGGSITPGQSLVFWQESYFVTLDGPDPLAGGNLLAVAQALAAALPRGGAEPALLSSLPAEGLEDGTPPIFFHQEISIQKQLDLGGLNRLGLGPETGGVLAAYRLDGERVWLLVIEYPDAKQAARGLNALRLAGMGSLLATANQGSLLAAAFGQADPALAAVLVNGAVK